jgi:hypothetical protein
MTLVSNNILYKGFVRQIFLINNISLILFTNENNKFSEKSKHLLIN